MKTSEALREFNSSVRELAEALGITREAVYQWGETVPALRVYQIRELLANKQLLAGESVSPMEHQEAA